MSGSINLTQTERLLEITSPLGAHKLILRRLAVEEAISRPFTISAEVLSDIMDLQPAQIVGKTITCTVKDGHAAARHFHGVVRSLTRLGPYARNLAAYRLEAVPRLWQLSRTADCRIFQEKSVKEILTTIFGEHDVAPIRWGGSVPSQKRHYCVQFNESDLEFIQRVLEEAGCSYFFEHSQNDHTLVIAGANADYPQLPTTNVVDPTPGAQGALSSWQPAHGLQPGKVVSQDYDGLKPNTLRSANAGTILGTANAASFEMFRWPGGQVVQPEGDAAKRGMEGFEAQADRIAARGNDPLVHAGGRLKVRPGIDVTAPVTWLVSAANHEAYDESHLVGGGSAGYSNALTLMPADRPFRALIPRPRPPMAGLHSAIVTGPSGEEIHCDEYGRVKVHFLWDRAGKTDDTSSCWVRVAQSHAGKWGGSWHLPRIGDEVLVGFVDADPDRPIIIGSLYNAEQKPIYTLPGNKTQSGFKTRSSKGGGATNFNELRFEDKKGSEEIHIQAERDMTLLIKHDRTETVKNDRTETVDGKHTETIKLDRSLTITQGNQSLVVKTGNMDTKVEMGNQSTLVKMGNIAHEASLGNISVKAGVGKIEMTALQSITLTCGMSKIEMTPTGISLSSLQIDVKATLALNTDAVFATHKAGGIMTIKGGIVMIN